MSISPTSNNHYAAASHDKNESKNSTETESKTNEVVSANLYSSPPKLPKMPKKIRTLSQHSQKLEEMLLGTGLYYRDSEGKLIKKP
jgi:hypothetical protein